jgi:hypothetical protein
MRDEAPHATSSAGFLAQELGDVGGRGDGINWRQF